MQCTDMPRSGAVRRGAAVLAVLAAGLAPTACNWDQELQYGSHVAVLDPDRSSSAFGWYQTELSHAVRFAPGTPTADPVELVLLNQFIDDVGVETNDEVWAIAGGPMAQQRTAAVVEAFSLRGHRITPQIDPLATEGDVTVTIRRVVYAASACVADGYPMRDGGTSMPLGCANALNLQGMVARPEELMGGLATESVETQPAVSAITRYRNGNITPLMSSEGTSGD
ncbi:MAG: CpaD family pilus assembly lipoprotein [Alphaproteobacteria bacterium]